MTLPILLCPMVVPVLNSCDFSHPSSAIEYTVICISVSIEEGSGRCVSSSYQNYHIGAVSNQLADSERGGECFGVDSESVDVKSGVNSSLYTSQSIMVSPQQSATKETEKCKDDVIHTSLCYP